LSLFLRDFVSLEARKFKRNSVTLEMRVSVALHRSKSLTY
jgi:hypothetical protein